MFVLCERTSDRRTLLFHRLSLHFVCFILKETAFYTQCESGCYIWLVGVAQLEKLVYLCQQVTPVSLPAVTGQQPAIRSVYTSTNSGSRGKYHCDGYKKNILKYKKNIIKYKKYIKNIKYKKYFNNNNLDTAQKQCGLFELGHRGTFILRPVVIMKQLQERKWTLF